MDYITTAVAARKLGTSLRVVQRLIQQGRLAARRVGRDYLILPADLDAVRDRPQGWKPGRPRKKPARRKAKST